MQQFTDSNLQWQAQLSKEEQQLRELLKVVIKELSHAPEGSLTITRKGTRTWYRHRIPGKPSRSLYINQKNKALIYRLAQKRYDRKLLRAIKLELRQVEQGKHRFFLISEQSTILFRIIGNPSSSLMYFLTISMRSNG